MLEQPSTSSTFPALVPALIIILCDVKNLITFLSLHVGPANGRRWQWLYAAKEKSGKHTSSVNYCVCHLYLHTKRALQFSLNLLFCKAIPTANSSWTDVKNRLRKVMPAKWMELSVLSICTVVLLLIWFFYYLIFSLILGLELHILSMEVRTSWTVGTGEHTLYFT